MTGRLMMGSAILCLGLMLSGCGRKSAAVNSALKPTAYGAAIVESSGGKQIAAVGTTLPQAVVVQLNDQKGAPVAGALVEFSGPAGVSFDPQKGLSDGSGQVTTGVALGSHAGRYRISASTATRDQKIAEVKIEEIALGYQQILGRQLNDQYCSRCHDPESTPERVSNYDNLQVKPHPFSEGETLNKMSDADLLAIISHGGPALNKSPLMPPYGYTLSKSDIQAVISYIRAISDPPYRVPGIVYAQK